MMKETDSGLKISDLKFNEFNPEELESMQLFHRQVIKMKECDIIKTRSLKIKVSHESTAEGLKTAMDAPSDEEYGILLLRIRPCLLTRDRIFFNRILNT